MKRALRLSALGLGGLREILVSAALISCFAESYVLPSPDGGAGSSPPALQGRIAAIAHRRIVVDVESPSGLPPAVAFRLGADTALFTVYGGLVSERDLVVGQRVRVWFERPGLPADPESSVAAAIMLASKSPGDEWP